MSHKTKGEYTRLNQGDPDDDELDRYFPTSDSGHYPTSTSKPKWDVLRHLRHGLRFTIIATALLLSGYAFHRYLSNYNDIVTTSTSGSSGSCCGSGFNYSSFYGIPTNLSAVPQKNLVNHTELNLQTQFNVSDIPRLREYTFNITQALSAPDGFQKPMILVNNQFPGPLIEANSGDTIRVHVNNFMTNWSTSIHWHGIDQRNTTWMDGVAAVSQCGIPPGENFTYEFVLHAQRGTFWYHSHLSVQYTDGLFGPFIIHQPDELIPLYDEERIIFMGDWYHTYGSLLVASYLSPTSRWKQTESGVEALADNLLLNGRSPYNCSVNSTTFPPNHDGLPPPICNSSQVERYVTPVEKGKTYRFRLINHSTFFSYWFSIDNHTLTIVEADGVEIEPIPFRGVYVNIGQRYSVIVQTNQTAGNYYMRATLPQTCFLPAVPYNSSGLNSTGFHALGILNYNGVNPQDPPIGVAGNTTNPFGAADNPRNNIIWEGCDDMPFNITIPKRLLPAITVSPLNMHYLEFAFRQSQPLNRIFMNKTSWAPLEGNATLWKTIGQNFSVTPNSYNSWSYNRDQEVLLVAEGNAGAQVVLNSLDGMEHPWHLHGHDFQIVGWGKGMYTEEGTTWNTINPMRRDTVTVPARSFVILLFLADNPGIWAFHCHIAWHMEGGMFVQFLERPKDLMDLVMHTLDPAVMEKSLDFCLRSDDQAFGTKKIYLAPDLVPNTTSVNPEEARRTIIARQNQMT